MPRFCAAGGSRKLRYESRIYCFISLAYPSDKHVSTRKERVLTPSSTPAHRGPFSKILEHNCCIRQTATSRKDSSSENFQPSRVGVSLLPPRHSPIQERGTLEEADPSSYKAWEDTKAYDKSYNDVTGTLGAVAHSLGLVSLVGTLSSTRPFHDGCARGGSCCRGRN